MNDVANKSAKALKFSGVVKYFKEVKAELKKVVWPTTKQLINNTTVVIVSIFVVGIVLWLVDLLFSNGLYFLIKK